MELISGGEVQVKLSGDSNVDRWVSVCKSMAEELFELGRCLNGNFLKIEIRISGLGVAGERAVKVRSFELPPLTGSSKESEL